MRADVNHVVPSDHLKSDTDINLGDNISYQAVANDVNTFLTSCGKDWSKAKQEKFKRMMLLGLAFKREGNPIAKQLYENWLFGPNQSNWGSLGDHESLSKAYGPSFSSLVHDPRPWHKLEWDTLRTRSKTIMYVESLAKKILEDQISSKKLPVKLILELRKMASIKGLAINKTHDFGNLNTLLSPKIHIDDETYKANYLTQLLNEKDLDSSITFGKDGVFWKLLKNRLSLIRTYSSPNSMPDIISSLGSFIVHQYIKGSFKISLKEEKKNATFKIEQLGLRIIDPYDFSLEYGNQSLGCWYPENGHDLSEVKLSLDNGNVFKALGAFIKCNLSNRDFESIKIIINKYNSSNPKYKLICSDYYVVTTMKKIILNKNLPSYEITL